jgi:hypothetical protein
MFAVLLPALLMKYLLIGSNVQRQLITSVKGIVFSSSDKDGDKRRSNATIQ